MQSPSLLASDLISQRRPDALDLRCPVLPQSLMEAMDLLQDPSAIEAHDVIAMAERDPMLLAQLLRTVNSAYYGLGNSITSPARVVMLLGPVSVVQTMAGLSLDQLWNAIPTSARVMAAKIVRHSLATAFLAQRMAEDTPAAQRAAQPGEAYTAGLMHDFGKLVLLHNFPSEAAAFYENGVPGMAGATPSLAAERLVFGCDHAQAGTAAATSAGFPAGLVQLLACQGDGAALPETPDRAAVAFLACLVAAASAASDALGFGLRDLPEAPPLADALLWDALCDAGVAGLQTEEEVLAWVEHQSEELALYVENLAPAAL